MTHLVQKNRLNRRNSRYGRPVIFLNVKNAVPPLFRNHPIVRSVIRASSEISAVFNPIFSPFVFYRYSFLAVLDLGSIGMPPGLAILWLLSKGSSEWAPSRNHSLSPWYREWTTKTMPSRRSATMTALTVSPVGHMCEQVAKNTELTPL